MFFFISSRRRHTRLQGDWSSDVCSSDLVIGDHGVAVEQQHVMGGVQRHAPVDGTDEAEVLLVLQQSDAFVLRRAFTQPLCDAWLRAGVIDDDQLPWRSALTGQHGFDAAARVIQSSVDGNNHIYGEVGNRLWYGCTDSRRYRFAAQKSIKAHLCVDERARCPEYGGVFDIV